MLDVSSPCSNVVSPDLLRKNDSLPLSATPSTVYNATDLDKENIGCQSEPRNFARRRKCGVKKPFCTSSSVLKELSSNFNKGASSLTSVFSLQSNVKADLSYVESPYGRFARISPSPQKYASNIELDGFDRVTPTSATNKLIQKRSIWLHNDESIKMETESSEQNALHWSSMAINVKYSPIPDSKMSTCEDQSPFRLVFAIIFSSFFFFHTFL